MIGILDNDLGNLRSVSNAVYSLGFDPVLINENDKFDDITHLIIPGVGNYYKAICNLHSIGLWESVVKFKNTKRPILGICLGMQLLSEYGEEGGGIEGLGFIRGSVVRIEAGEGYPLPHIGWNTVEFKKTHPVLEGVKNNMDFYFVHSYNFRCTDKSDVYGTTDYSDTINAIVASDNVIGFQFHPEKSQQNGLQLLENFLRWNGEC